MKEYSYIEHVTADALEAIRDRYSDDEIRARIDDDRAEFAEQLNDDLWTDDGVTGNASGSYTFCSARAREYVLGDPESVIEAAREFCAGMSAAELMSKLLDEDWEYFDVTARCYYLGQAIDAALDQLDAEIPATPAA